ncbi:Flp family type IVb pilin [Fulvimarina endophytica]|uniref:Flp family type IVb pilin n=1 Tax=Fulvimarina endophytica TaxID=2293836 RepID=A0A371X710_9HYPH|nr:Flp family type IVb pilin [Fulvimarina endophytica]RFC64981.1 Flp family type IVb pilin [Fulvimarina endophytica]
MSKMFSRFLKNESGATAIEYALIAGLMAVVCISAITALGTTMENTFETIKNALAPAS